jgi:xylulokinase
MYLIGYDIGSSSVKAAIVDGSNGKTVAVVNHPPVEMPIDASQLGWAEQDPAMWWEAVCITTKKLLHHTSIDPHDIKSIGISYQMHGLVLVDDKMEVLRPSIIWCDSRAVQIGENAFNALGAEFCNSRLLNSPGNFTASKLKWVKDNEPNIFDRIYKMMLPGDYIAMKLSGTINTTISGLSEGIFWDFKSGKISEKLIEHYGFSSDILPDIVDTFGVQSAVDNNGAEATGLTVGTTIGYRAGDQPNNALSLSVFEPGEVAATGGTSGVMYGISDVLISDSQSRTNAFAHVNHSQENPRIGQLLCINGAGSQYAWIKKNISKEEWSYGDMEEQITSIPIGSDGLRILPFGNGSERFLGNKLLGAQINNLQFNRHSNVHLIRAALEGIAFSFVHGFQVLKELSITPNVIKVGNDNLFQSDTFSKTIANLLQCDIEMLNTTGAVGAAKASGINIGLYSSPQEAIASTLPVKIYHPEGDHSVYEAAYNNWENDLIKILNN